MAVLEPVETPDETESEQTQDFSPVAATTLDDVMGAVNDLRSLIYGLILWHQLIQSGIQGLKGNPVAKMMGYSGAIDAAASANLPDVPAEWIAAQAAQQEAQAG